MNQIQSSVLGHTSDTHEILTNSIDPEKQNEPPPAAAPAQRPNNAQQEQSPLPEQSQEQTDSPYRPKTSKFWLILLCNFMCLLLVALDRTIIATAIPRITDEFHSLSDIGWYGSSYMLASASSQLLFGRIYKFYNIKRVFLTSVVGFEIGSTICGAAPTSGAFIAGRAIAGFASSGIFSGCMLIVISMVPLHKRPMFQGMFGATFGIASILGPLVGGAFTSNVTWRWCFYINLPIGVVGLLAMTLVWCPKRGQHDSVPISAHLKRLDPLGMFFFVPSIICLLLALQWGGSTYAWSNGRIIALFVVFAVLITIFGTIQVLKPDTATIPARVITRRIQTVKLVNPVHSGIYTLPLVLSLVVASIIGGIITQKIGYYVPAMYTSPSIMAIGLGLMSTFNLNTSSSHWVGYQFLAGFGLGLGMQINGLVVQRVLPPPDIPIGIALMFFLQQLGGSIFTTVGQTILSNLLRARLSGIQGIDGGLIASQGATELVKVVSEKDIGVVQEAYNYACTRIFLVALGATCAALVSSLGMEWKSIKKGKNGQDVSGQSKDGEVRRPLGSESPRQ
ncbi:major facilitator superfamily domain-containing protein [Penicillium angulare]|uniref:major facilitator superfamily domain-containing protein n=1 Tax=Penicillium angulare TaxID=116970 RepID=UPI0025411917|nr:major facilitator superfamily domain-containing protein [Penicillium angulare]KAJ5259508.1 major facilitator superfamily domain-containing protein [Penicillium angulare]